MKTIINQTFFLDGDEIPEKPQIGTKCHLCGEIINPEGKHAKIASLIAKKDDKLIINWNWFCIECFEEFDILLDKPKLKED